MPVARYTLTAAARGLRAFLNLEAGVTRDDAKTRPDSPRNQPAKPGELERLRGLLAEKDRQIAALRATGDGAGEYDPRNIVWIFGSGRSGSTWLSSMMGELEGYSLWGEPWVGYLFGHFYYYWVDERRRDAPQFIMGRHKDVWLRAIRKLIVESADVLFGGPKREGHLIIKEPNGSIGAPLLMKALPESRMILLTIDPRDVVASTLDARREGGWHFERNKGRPLRGWIASPDDTPVAFAEERATRYLWQMGKAKEAYDLHEGPKVLVRYEGLRSDTLGTMRRIYSTLGIPVDTQELERVVEKHSWENIPEEEKGKGKFYRKATPNGWQEDLTQEQIEVVERITAPLIRELYP